MADYSFISGSRKCHLGYMDSGETVCGTRLYKKDHAMVCTVLFSDNLLKYVDYTTSEGICMDCVYFANEHVTKGATK